LACVADLARVASLGLSPHTEGAQRVGIVAGRLALATSRREQQSFEMMDILIAEPDHWSEPPPRFPFAAGRPFGRASCAPPSPSAAVAQFGR
jgi:hypothetical protein